MVLVNHHLLADKHHCSGFIQISARHLVQSFLLSGEELTESGFIIEHMIPCWARISHPPILSGLMSFFHKVQKDFLVVDNGNGMRLEVQLIPSQNMED